MVPSGKRKQKMQEGNGPPAFFMYKGDSRLYTI